MYTIIAFILSGVVMIIFGILIRECKFYNLIAGYNVMFDEKKKSYNPQHSKRIKWYIIEDPKWKLN